MFNIKKEIKLAFSENKYALIVSCIILFLSIIFGYLFQKELYSLLNPVVDNLTNQIKSGTIQLTFQSIFFNNLHIIISMFIYGVVFCFSGLILGFNGFFTGYYVATSNNIFTTLLLIVPHGIFEFSSCIIACMSGFVLFNFFFKLIKELLTQKEDSIKKLIEKAIDLSYPKLKQSILLFLISVILMAIAGVIEVYFTVPIAQFVFSIFSKI